MLRRIAIHVPCDDTSAEPRSSSGAALPRSTPPRRSRVGSRSPGAPPPAGPPSAPRTEWRALTCAQLGARPPPSTPRPRRRSATPGGARPLAFGSERITVLASARPPAAAGSSKFSTSARSKARPRSVPRRQVSAFFASALGSASGERDRPRAPGIVAGARQRRGCPPRWASRAPGSPSRHCRAPCPPSQQGPPLSVPDVLNPHTGLTSPLYGD